MTPNLTTGRSAAEGAASRNRIALVVRPVRFTDRPAEMRHFLETLGLRPRIEAERGGWVDLVGSGGLVALHDAESSDVGADPGQTLLSFEIADADALAHLLAHPTATTGFSDVAVVDESYGRTLSVVDPLGQRILLDERATDLYGYRRHPAGAPAIGVEAVRWTDDVDGCHRALTALGLEGAPVAGEYTTYAAEPADEGGWIGVHPLGGDRPAPGLAGEAAAGLAFRGDIDAVLGRLTSAGYAAQRCVESFATILRLTDPDGCRVEVHPWPG